MNPKVKVIVVGDSDSYVKWGAALASRMPADWDLSLSVLATPVLPSTDQLTAALEGTSITPEQMSMASLRSLALRIAVEKPDLVVLSLRGPLVRVVVRAVVGASRRRRPVLISGLPGITIPAARKAIVYRSQADLVVLHSRREVREFTELAGQMGAEQAFGLATLPFLLKAPTTPSVPGGNVIFAAQAIVPKHKSERLRILGWLAETARAHPDRKVVIKVRASRGEHQTHVEKHDYESLLAELEPAPPANLVVANGLMARHLAGASGLVTVSSTAAIEALALDVPTLMLDDFGVSAGLINTVFEGSGLFGSSAELMAGRFRKPLPDWVDDNYLHEDSGDDDWLAHAKSMLAQRERGQLPLRRAQFGTFGGALRRAWDRKRALGPYDKTISGQIALIIAVPARYVVRRLRRLRKRLLRAAAAAARPAI